MQDNAQVDLLASRAPLVLVIKMYKGDFVKTIYQLANEIHMKSIGKQDNTITTITVTQDLNKDLNNSKTSKESTHPFPHLIPGLSLRNQGR